MVWMALQQRIQTLGFLYSCQGRSKQNRFDTRSKHHRSFAKLGSTDTHGSLLYLHVGNGRALMGFTVGPKAFVVILHMRRHLAHIVKH